MPERILWGMVRRLFGNRGERAAEKFLKKQGMRILERQAENRCGEVDLIALDGDCVVFIEVKTRRSQETNHPSEAIDARKRRNMTRSALVWLKKNRLFEQRVRFDVVTVVWPPNQKEPTIQHFRNAFEATGV